MKITFWGVRGSVPSPSRAGFDTGRYGGNTACVAVRKGGVLLVLDGGTGLRVLGRSLPRAAPLAATILFSHFHWDHIQGFPFFEPAFSPGTRLDLYAPRLGPPRPDGRTAIDSVLDGQQTAPNFPVGLARMRATLAFHDLAEADEVVLSNGGGSGLRITAARLNHPNGVFGYRVEEIPAGKAFVYATDTEHLDGGPNPALTALARGADLIIYDSQFTEDEYSGRSGFPRAGWGHSTGRRGLAEAQAASARGLVIFHHDPGRDDAGVDVILSDVTGAAAGTGVRVLAASEGLEIDLS